MSERIRDWRRVVFFEESQYVSWRRGHVARRKSYVAALCLFLTLAAVLGGCASSPTELVTFESEYVSLQLPDSFVGGDPEDPSVMAALEERAASNPDPDERSDIQSYLSEVKAHIQERSDHDLENLGPLLVVLGQPDKDGSTPSVLVDRSPIERGLMPRTGGDSSMEALVGAEMLGCDKADWSIESLTEDRAYVTYRHQGATPGDMTFQKHIVLRATQEYMYEFYYAYYEQPNAALEGVFAASVQTAVVKAPYDVPKQIIDQTKYRQDADCEGLVEDAKYAIEQAHKELGTCDPSVVTPSELNKIEPDIVFIVVKNAEAALAPEAATARNEVAYWGDVGTYTVGSCSESGKTYGVFHDMADPGWYRVFEGIQPGFGRYEIPVDN